MSKEKVVHIKDNIGSVRYLQSLINGIKAGNVKTLVCIASKEIDITDEPDMYVVDGDGKKMDEYDREPLLLTDNYFFGECPTTQLIGLSQRMTHILNKYADGHKYQDDS